mgnify:CR=1 FL=1
MNNGFNNTESYRFQMNAALKWSVPWVEGLSAQASLNFTTSYYHQRHFNHDQEAFMTIRMLLPFLPIILKNAKLI